MQELHGDFDSAVLAGTRERDFVDVLGFGGAIFVIGLPVFVQIEDAGAADELRIDGRGGDDQLSASSLKAGAIRLVLDGGNGDNVIAGGDGDDLLIGGDGFDDVDGNKGDDVARMGAYFDRFSWAPGDGNDRVDGQGSHDSLFFLGTADSERFDLTADGREVLMRRDVGDVVMELRALEEIDTLAHGGADTFAIGDLTGTPVDLVDVSLAPGFGSPGGDGQADRVLVTGTPGDDSITVTGSRGTARATGLPATVNITHAEVARDTLAIDTRTGDDDVDSAGLAPDTIGLAVD